MGDAERMLEGRRAIVTGASRGIGAEIARAMARSGAAVVLAARDAGSLARVAEDQAAFTVFHETALTMRRDRWRA